MRLAFLCLLLPSVTAARLDLSAATVERFDNGLTLIVLEEPAFPLVSVQMVYRVGARNEPAGGSGIAHFLEHMAFRSSENFPDTGLVSSIYAVGGEWHGYTWLDQTTYYATAPREELDLLLRIEADRMARLDLPENKVEAERGAVLSELHGYENDPDAVLQDQLMYVSFLAHPYRNNTIGWKSDVLGMTHAELVGFYRRHYHAGNAVLAVVGDVETAAVIRRVGELFGAFAGRAPTPRPRTVEPRQPGERRVELVAPVDRPRYRMAWRAPSVHHPDFATFLVLQDLLAAGSGVSFLQNDWGAPARAGSPLGRIGGGISTWYPPSDQDYAFVVSGALPEGFSRAELESAVAETMVGVARALEDNPGALGDSIEAARDAVRRELVFDIQTTEDAAHQLAFFEGMGALDVLRSLPGVIDDVNAAGLARAIRHWLGRDQRSIAWMRPAAGGSPTVDGVEQVRLEAESRKGVRGDALSAPAAPAVSPPATLHRLSNGLPVILQPSPLSATVQIRLLVPGSLAFSEGRVSWDAPAWDMTSLVIPLVSGSLAESIEGLPALLRTAQPMSSQAVLGDDPQSRMSSHLQDLLGLSRAVPGQAAPALIVLAGDFDPVRALPLLESNLASLPLARLPHPPPLNPSRKARVESSLDSRFAQERIGYVARAPGPREPGAVAAWLALYVLSHGYEGRLGKKAISRRGLVYYIDAEYQSNGRDAWISLEMGVDPENRTAMQALLRSELARLQAEPPTEAELAEARRYLLGRYRSAAQSNPELTARMARDWLWFGTVLDETLLRQRLEAVTRQQVIDILPPLVGGTEIVVRNPRQPERSRAEARGTYW